MPPSTTQADKTAFIVLVSEDDGANLVRARLHMEDIYQRQQGAHCSKRCFRNKILERCLASLHLPSQGVGLSTLCAACCLTLRAETILSWNEPDTGIDYALSFQEPDGCTELWEQIRSLQGRLSDEPAREWAEKLQPAAAGLILDAATVAGGGEQVPVLPAAELRNLAAIAELLAEVPSNRRTRVADMLVERDYIPQLVNLFAMAEDMEGVEDLHLLFAIFKGIVMLNNTNIYEVLLRDDMRMGCAARLPHTPLCHIRLAHSLRMLATLPQGYRCA